ncbi:MAG: hypothetical protein AB7K52_10870 [Phycisphaerales bacterium]
MTRSLAALLLATCAGSALAQPQFITLPGSPTDINDDGTVVVGSNGGTFRWVRSGGNATYTILNTNTAGGGTATVSGDGSVVVASVQNTNELLGMLGFAVAARWTSGTGFVEQHDPNVFFGTGTPNTLNVPRNSTRDGRYVVGFGYANSGIGGYRPMIHDMMTGTGVRPPGITGQAARILCVSDDALVLAGDDDVTGSAQRPAIWRWNGSSYVGQIVDAGTGGASSSTINAISADGSKATGQSYLENNKLWRWEYNAGTEMYDKVEKAAALTPPGTALTRVQATAMTPDGETIYGTYNNSRAFVWTAATGMQDLTNLLVAEGITGLPAGAVIGNVQACSANGRALVGAGGLGGTSFVIFRDGDAGCIAPAAVPAPSTTTISMCSRTVSLNASITGSGPFTYQWRKNGMPIVPGPTGNMDVNGLASTYSEGLSPAQFRISNAGPLDAGSFDCVVTNSCGSLTIDPIVVTAADADLYDTCATAFDMQENVATFAMCGLYVNEGLASCATTQRADVWIRYTPTFTGEARITTCGQSNFDTILSLHSDCTSLTEVSCNNNYCNSLASIERFNVTMGEPVLIRLAVGSSVPSTPVQINIFSAPPAPVNDTCANATVVGEGVFTGDSTEAGTENIPSCNANAGKDIWWSYVPSANGTATFETCGSNFNTVLSVHPSCGAPSSACNDNANVTGCSTQSRLSDIPVMRDVPVLVRVSGNAVNLGGSVNLSIVLTPSACPQDFNGDGTINPDDLGDFINCYFATPPCSGADFNDDGGVDPDDLGDFINAYFGPAC